MRPVIEWWVQNFSVISDIVTRGYDFHMVAYDSVLASPEQTLRAVLGWLGGGEVESAVAQVLPALRTQHRDPADNDDAHVQALGTEVIETFDALYELVRGQRSLRQSFVDRLNATNDLLRDQIDEAVTEATESHRRTRAAPQGRGGGSIRSSSL
jgi:hypothetical protein